jgi:AcrR family transcriptional regulator
VSFSFKGTRMLAVRSTVDAPIHLSIAPAPSRASIGARRNPASTRAIRDAAAAILLRDGVAGLSIDAIARHARCGKPTVYRWWPDKMAILSDLHSTEVRALPSGDRLALADWLDAVRNFWSEKVAGLALRALIAEAQSARDGRARLRDALAPYEAAALATNDGGDTALARAAVAQLSFGLLVDGADGGIRVIQPAAAPTPVVSAEPQSLRHRGEWVD